MRGEKQVMRRLRAQPEQKEGKERYVPSMNGSTASSDFGSSLPRTVSATKVSWDEMASTGAKNLGYRRGYGARSA